MGLLQLLTSNPLAFVIIAGALILSLAIHEFAHAWTADRLGDPTPRSYGRVTLNPLKHLDPLGMALMLLVGFGFAKPVPINPNKLGRWGTVWVSAAGPLSNLLIAIICVLLLKVFGNSYSAQTVLLTVLSINIVLAVFNLLPIPMLDGSRILGGIFPFLGRSLAQFESLPYSFLIVMGFIFIFQNQISTITQSIQHWILSIFN